MNFSQTKHPLIRNILILISILTVFLITIFFYFFFSNEKQTTLENKIRLYNDLSATSALKIKDHLATIRITTFISDEAEKIQAIDTKIYEIGIDLNKLAKAQETYKEERFAFLVTRLSQQRDHILMQSKNLNATDTNGAAQLFSTLDAMDITLQQIYRLHTQQARAQRKEHLDFFVNFDRWILAFTFLLFTIGAIAIKKGIGQIKFSLSEQDRMEQALRTNNQALESKVKKRTHELEQSLIQLKNENNERLHAEQLMRTAKDEAEDANQLKSDFLGRMSHELRTPLNAILGFGQLLQEENLANIQKENVNEIMKAGWHLLHLIDEVLDLTTIENGKLKIHIDNVAIQEIAEESISLVEQQAAERNIRIENYITDNSILARADKVRTREVIMNLLTNAIKYNKENGLITVNLVRDNNMLKLQVTDTGPGLSEQQQKVIFEPFMRLEAEFSDIQGTGIGLTISSQLMELMQGSIGVDSKQGEGSTFWIKLQESSAQPNPDHQNKSISTKSISSNGKSILYVEDNPANLLLVENIIKKHSQLHFMSATNAELGIEIARSKQPDLIMLDLNLPGMDGYEALSRLRNYPETKDIPTIALSAAAMPNDIKRGLMAGFKHYVTKPVNVSELCNIIEHELGCEQKAAK